MKIHYNNTENEKLIDNVIAVQFDGDGEHISCCTKSGHEYRINVAHVETIIDDELTEGVKKDTAEVDETIKRLAAEKDAAEEQKSLYEMALFEIIRQAFILPLGKALNKTDEEIADKVFETIDETFKTLDKNGIAAAMLKSSRYKNIPVGEQRPVKKGDDYCGRCVRKATGACSSCITTEHPSGRISRPSHFLPKDEAK
jgi:hypothetical protein